MQHIYGTLLFVYSKETIELKENSSVQFFFL